MTSAKYRIYVRLKNGDQVGGREIGTVKARIGSSHTEERGGFASTLVTKIVYADEI